MKKEANGTKKSIDRKLDHNSISLSSSFPSLHSILSSIRFFFPFFSFFSFFSFFFFISYSLSLSHAYSMTSIKSLLLQFFPHFLPPCFPSSSDRTHSSSPSPSSSSFSSRKSLKGKNCNLCLDDDLRRKKKKRKK